MAVKKLFRLRSKSRQKALQALYAWTLVGTPIGELQDFFIPDCQENNKDFDVDYFSCIINGVIEHVEQLDKTYLPFINPARQAIDPIENTILRIAVFEIVHLHLPLAVAINEAIELAKMFGSEESYKFVNSVLDKITSAHNYTVAQHASLT